jgi:hypothetical protein
LADDYKKNKRQQKHRVVNTNLIEESAS